VLHEGTYANLDSLEDVFTIGINRAVALLAEKAAGGKKPWSRPKAQVLKDLGEHPEGGGKVEVLSGRYGPYVRHGKLNATLPKGKDPSTLGMEEAVELLAKRASRGESGPPKRAKSKAANGKAKPRSAKPRPAQRAAE
jgi:DNA topoisomerase-1